MMGLMPKVFEELYDRTCALCMCFVIDAGFKSPCKGLLAAVFSVAKQTSIEINK